MGNDVPADGWTICLSNYPGNLGVEDNSATAGGHVSEEARLRLEDCCNAKLQPRLPSQEDNTEKCSSPSLERWNHSSEPGTRNPEPYCQTPNNVGENVVIPYSYLALPPSRPLFPSATETVKPEGPSSSASRYQARPLIGPSDTQDA